MFKIIFFISIAISFVKASTVSMMAKYVDSERLAGERRMEALYAKKTDVLCPGFTQKGMSLCVRQYIKNYKIQTASSYMALTHFIQIASNQDSNARIYDPITAQLISLESLVHLQLQLKKENMVCGELRPAGIQHLLEVKQVCMTEEEQLKAHQEVTKKHILKKLGEISPKINKVAEGESKQWMIKKEHELRASTALLFEKRFYEAEETKITAENLTQQNSTIMKTSCKNLEPRYVARFLKVEDCERKFSQFYKECLPYKEPQNPLKIQLKELMASVQKALPCYHAKVQSYLSQN